MQIPRSLVLLLALMTCLPGTKISLADPTAPATFLGGADLSQLPYYEAKGVKYSDGGKEAGLLAIARQNGWKIVRVRLWVDPNKQPEYDVSSLHNVVALGKRIKAAGFQFLLDIHYSDTWADPGHQKKPAAWENLPFDQLVERVRSYSSNVMGYLQRGGATPDIVQIGNETKNGLLYGSGINGAGAQPGGGFWETDKAGMDRAVRLLAAGIEGVRSGASPAKPLTMIHVPDGQETMFVQWYFSNLTDRANAIKVPLDYDMIGLSYYPADPWNHQEGYDSWRLSHLVETMNYIATVLKKPLMIVETNWPQAGKPLAIPGTPEFPLTPAGQAQYYAALIAAVKAVPDGMGRGVLAWETDHLDWQSVFDSKGQALPAVRVLGGKTP